jgi:hypothetical protein
MILYEHWHCHGSQGPFPTFIHALRDPCFLLILQGITADICVSVRQDSIEIRGCYGDYKGFTFPTTVPPKETRQEQSHPESRCQRGAWMVLNQ